MVISINFKKNITRSQKKNKPKSVPFVPQKEIRTIEKRLRKLGYID